MFLVNFFLKILKCIECCRCHEDPESRTWSEGSFTVHTSSPPIYCSVPPALSLSHTPLQWLPPQSLIIFCTQNEWSLFRPLFAFLAACNNYTQPLPLDNPSCLGSREPQLCPTFNNYEFSATLWLVYLSISIDSSPTYPSNVAVLHSFLFTFCIFPGHFHPLSQIQASCIWWWPIIVYLKSRYLIWTPNSQP